MVEFTSCSHMLRNVDLPPFVAAEQTMYMPAMRRHWTTEDVRALMDESRHWPRYELIDGELIVTPAPGVIHQIAVAELWRVIDAYVDAERLGVAMISPSDVELRPGTITQPDVFVVPRAVLPIGDATMTWPDVTSLLLAVEIISPSSVRTDRIKKRDYYLDAGVAEYWVVDLDARIVERWLGTRDTPSVESKQFDWMPNGASQPMRVEVAALMDRIRGKLRGPQ